MSNLGWNRYSLTEIKSIFTELWIRNDITFEYTAIYKTWWPTVCTVYYWGHCFVLGISSLYPELASWCGSGYPTSTLNSKFSTLMISFSSDDSDNNYRGFKIAYWAKTNGKGSPVVARLAWSRVAFWFSKCLAALHVIYRQDINLRSRVKFKDHWC